ncbi:MAG: lipase family protein [Aeromicrobium sp.]
MRIPRWVVGVVAVIASTLAAPSPAVSATPSPDTDSFYTYTDSKPLSEIAPGSILKTRTGTVTFPAIPQPVTWIQLLYRTRTQLGDPTVTVTTILNPPAPLPIKRVVSYQSFYDSLTTRCEPSYMLNGGPANSLWTSEENFYQSLLLQGYTVVTSDFEGQDPTFGTGPVYGYQTLDGIRAAYNSVDVGLPVGTKVAMAGYSGGAIATEWATELASDYAPDVNANLVGSAMGGVFVHPIHNLHYVDGAAGSWSSVMPLALIGIAKAFNIDLTPYLSTFGAQVVNTVKHDCIGEHSYPSLTFASLVKPEYAKPESLSFLVNTANELIMGTGGTPTVPLFIRQGTDGSGEGTEPSPQYGPGDGVMLVNDVRSLARKYCAAGRPIDYLEKPLGHGDQGADFLAEMIPWVQLRFTPTPALDTCALIQEGNSLEPTTLQQPTEPKQPDDPTVPGKPATPGRPNQSAASTATCRGKAATIVGTASADKLTGTPGNDVIIAGPGNDTIDGKGGTDTICGGTGKDVLKGGRGKDTLRGGDGNDRLYGGSGRDSLRGGKGNDRLYGGGGRDSLRGGKGKDQLHRGS